MPLDYLKYEEFISLVVSEFRTQQPDIDPTTDEFVRGFNEGLAAACLSLQSLIRDLENNAFPQTSRGTDLDKWGGYEDLERGSDVGAFGNFSLPGTPGTLVPILTEFQAGNGLIYSATAASSISDITDSISTLTRSGSLVTAQTGSEHNLATGMEVTIAGASPSDYNGTFVISVTALDEYTYTIGTTPSTPATGTITFNAQFANVPIKCTTTGIETNLDSGATIANSTISGGDSEGFVQFGGIAGGTSEELDEFYLNRILLSRSLLEGVFTRNQVQLAALSIEGNTRAFVVSPQLSTCSGSPTFPTPGQVSVYILRDNDPSIIPSQPVLDATKQAVIDDGRLPAHTAEIDVFVLAPVLITTDFTFTSITPDTETMRTAIQNDLTAFFQDSVQFATDVEEASYLGAIINTQDLVTGDFLTNFTLSTPIGDIIVAQGEIASLGSVTFV